MSLQLNTDMAKELSAVRSAVKNLSRLQHSGDRSRPVDLIDQGNQMVHCFGGWLLDDEQEQALSVQPWDLFILHASSYLCDIGLSDGDDLSSLLKSRHDPRTAASPTESLSKRTCQLIRDKWLTLGIGAKTVADAIARVCLLAGADDGVNLPATESGDVVIDNTVVNIPLLAACLRLGRALDLTSALTVLQICGQASPAGSISPDRLEDNFTVVGVGAHPYLSSTIQLKIQCSDPEVHRALKHHERTVQQLLETLNQRVRPRFLYSDVIFEIEPAGYTPIDLKFTVDSSAGLQLFMGNRLYSDKRVFLRELIQNAVDACNYRKLVDGKYSPAIAIEFNEDVSTIKVRDNGIGMTRQWIEKYFLAIGISFYQSDEIQKVNRDTRIDFGFISQFGIGFLSSFQVAEKIVIKTRRASFPGLMITIGGLRDYFDVRVLAEDCPVGTEVTLHLKKSNFNYCRSMEYTGYLKTNIRFLKVPVNLKDRGGNTITIGREQLAYDTDKKGGTIFVAPLKFSESEGYVRLGAKKNGKNIYALESADGGVSVFQDGIFVTQVTSLLPEGARQSAVTRINLMGQDKCELSMDRNRMFWTPDQLQNIKRVIRHGLVDVVNQLISDLESQDVPLNTTDSIVNQLAIIFDFSDVDDVMYHQLPERIRRVVEKRFRDFVRINFAHTLKKNGIAEADGYSETWQQHVLKSFVKI